MNTFNQELLVYVSKHVYLNSHGTHKSYFSRWRLFNGKWKIVSHLILDQYLLNTRQTSDLSEVTKFHIVYLHKEGKTRMLIGKEVKISQANVSWVLRKYFNIKCFQNKLFKSDRKPAILTRDESKLKRVVKKHRFRSVRYLLKKWKAVDINASKSTTLQWLQKLGFKSCVSKTYNLSKQLLDLHGVNKSCFAVKMTGKRCSSLVKVCFIYPMRMKVYAFVDLNKKLLIKNV